MRFAAWCFALVACDGPGEYGERCSTDDDCGASLKCLGFADDRHCFHACTVENRFQCPEGYECVGPRDTSDKPCLRTCESDRDCPHDLTCKPWAVERFCSW
jgi:hypothetical protein